MTIVSTVTGPPPVSVAAPTNVNKTATKVANSGGHANNTQAPAKRSSSGADGDYALVQHEVLYSLSAQYEVSVGGRKGNVKGKEILGGVVSVTWATSTGGG